MAGSLRLPGQAPDRQGMLQLVRGHLGHDGGDVHAPEPLVDHVAPQRGIVAGVKDALQVAPRGLHAVDDLRHREVLRKARVVVVLGARAGYDGRLLGQGAARALGVDALDTQQVREVRRDGPTIFSGVAKLFLTQPADEVEEPFAAVLEIGTQL